MDDLQNKLLAMLFTSPKPLSLKAIANATKTKESNLGKALKALSLFLKPTCLEVRVFPKGYLLVTKPDYAEFVGSLPHTKKPQLSSASLEVLAVVAYQQPVSKASIDEQRGVQSDVSLQNLQELRLIEEVIRTIDQVPEAYWQTTEQFLLQFGLEDIDELPKPNINPPK
jgi:segregation and condensation protein B